MINSKMATLGVASASTESATSQVTSKSTLSFNVELYSFGKDVILLQKSDLKYHYSWKAIPNDNPNLIRHPDFDLLNRNEGYEVLRFVNRFAEKQGLKNKSDCLKVERLINEHLRSDTHSHSKVEKWLIDNWNKFDK